MSVRRGEIYFVNLNPVQGREQAGERPVLILSYRCDQYLASGCHYCGWHQR